MKNTVGKLLRFLATISLLVLSLLDLLTILFSGLSREIYQIPQIVLFFNKFFHLFFLVIFIYGLYLLIKNNRKYLKLFAYSLPAYYLFITIYRFLFITHGQLENTDFNNLIFLAPLVLVFLSAKLEQPKVENLEINSIYAPFSPLQYQGIIVRGFANFVDQILIIIPLIFVGSLTNKLGDDEFENLAAIGGLIFLIYMAVSEAVWGQTLGKKLFGIKVMMQDGRKCTAIGAILRNIFRMADLALGGYILAMIVMTITPKRQRIGDLIAKTAVIKPSIFS
jgi:uncharacterized RDD family membrane protein YckC